MRPLAYPAALGLALLSLGACGQSSGSGVDPEKTARLLAELPAPYNTADPARGRSSFALCSACHTLPEGGPNLAGPNLHGVFGARAASKPGFAYSAPLTASGWTWDAARLDSWITDPVKALPGTKMVFVGIKDAQQRANLIAYLKVATSD